MRKGVAGQVLRFAVVGGVGFVIDGGLLWAMTANGVNPYLARAISFPLAVLATWWLNRQWTFRAARDASSRGQLRRYFAVQMIGSLTNYAAYAVVVAVFGSAQVVILAGFALGSALGAVLNFLGARYFAFRAHLH